MSTTRTHKTVIPAYCWRYRLFRRLNGAALTRLLTRADVGKWFLNGRSAWIADVAGIVAY